MEIDLDIEGLTEGLEVLQEELDAATAQAMRTSVELVAATAKELAPKKTSALEASIMPLPVSGSFSAGTLEGEVAAGAPHALPQEEGARPHEIRPRYRRALRWPVEGGYKFAGKVNHPGNKPQPFMAPALERNAEDIAAEFGAAIEIALRRAGF